MWQQMGPREIERCSLEIIEREMGASTYPAECLPVVQRVIHTTADFDFAHTLFFSPGAVAAGRDAISRGANIITDTNMAAAGINKQQLARYGGRVLCYMADPVVAQEAALRGITRAAVSMERAVRETPGAIFAIGNAPTALLRLCELIASGQAQPALVVGAPVGFVNVVEAKEKLMQLPVPQIVPQGRKGGSTVAAAIINALLYGIGSDDE
jgi:precorrin-8X/cobalt-precorrin-8 methylmutase